MYVAVGIPVCACVLPWALSSFSGQCWRWTTPNPPSIPSYWKPFRARAA